MVDSEISEQVSLMEDVELRSQHFLNLVFADLERNNNTLNVRDYAASELLSTL